MMMAKLALALIAAADGPTVHAIVVASSQGGEGQAPLAHAAADAKAVEAVLADLGRARVERLIDPSPSEVLRAIEAARAEATGPSSMFVFYYSGHARAEAIDLGREPLSLAVLRRALDAVPATFRLVVLDACQSGAYAAVKGAAPAADFTVSSARALATEGSAVIASSTGSELSQESPELGGSYFTHHWVVGLRGAGDANGDGRVTLREAYDYAYDRTLISTAMTSIGRQHPVLETRLKGHGDVVLSYPALARGHLDLAAREAIGALVVSDRDVVMAEVEVPAGRAVRLALPLGGYVAWVRQGEQRRRCAVELIEGVAARVDPEACPVVEQAPARPKGEAYALDEGWGVELGVGLKLGIDDAYVRRLEDFGYSGRFDLSEGLRGRASVVRRIVDPFAAVLSVDLLDRRGWQRETPRVDAPSMLSRFEYSAWSVIALGRVGLELGAGFSAYAQAGAGVAFGFSSLEDSDEVFVAPALRVGGGIDLRVSRWISLYLQLGWTLAPVIDNLAGDTHESGGFDDNVGVRVEL